MIHYLTMGTVLGLAGGFAPGPLLTLVIAETLQHDVKSGVKVALAPLITDLPIIILTLFILSKLSNFNNILGIISLLGGLFILFMGCQSIRTQGVEINPTEIKSRSLTKGILANALSPHPYLFWLSVGAPLMTKAMGQNIGASLAFIISFYVFLVGSKILLAISIGKAAFLLTGRAYLLTMRLLGAALCVLAIVLFQDGLKLMGII